MKSGLQQQTTDPSKNLKSYKSMQIKWPKRGRLPREIVCRASSSSPNPRLRLHRLQIQVSRWTQTVDGEIEQGQEREIERKVRGTTGGILTGAGDDAAAVIYGSIGRSPMPFFIPPFSFLLFSFPAF